MTPLERAARALAVKHYAERFAKPETDHHVQINADANITVFLSDARAAIEAIREPSEAMVEAGRWPAEDEGSYASWTAMIDALLAEGGK